MGQDKITKEVKEAANKPAFRINICPACSLYGHGGKSRIAIEHTCGLSDHKNNNYDTRKRRTNP